MSSVASAQLINAKSLPKEILREISRAQLRVGILVTTIHDDSSDSKAIIAALIDAAARGVHVSVSADIFTYIEPKGNLLTGIKAHYVRALRSQSLARRLGKHGVDFHWLGRMSNFIFTGRTHSKWIIIDDVIFTFGGVNLDQNSFTNTDYLFRINDRAIADRLYAEMLHIKQNNTEGRASRSRKVLLGDGSAMLIDGGIPGDSLIYRRAVSLAREAASITLVSQYCPTGPLSQQLARKKAILYFNHWRHARWVNMIIIQIGMLISKQITNYRRRPYLHAKFALFTMPNGDITVLTGSHNFTRSGVMTGTREIALETQDPAIISQLKEFLDHEVK